MSLVKSESTKKTAKVVIASAILLFAAWLLLAPVTGAKFTASGNGSVDVSTAKLTLGLSDGSGSSGTFALKYLNLKPGETQTQKLVVTNTGSIDGDATFAGLPAVSNVTGSLQEADYKELAVAIPGFLAATGLDQLPQTVDLGTLKAGETKTFEVKVSLDQKATNEWQDVKIATTATVVLEQQD